MQHISDASLAQATRQLAQRLGERGWLLATAESCTGGWVAKCCTDLPGSSGWFDRGFVTYSNAAKQAQLGVSAETLRRHGAVSRATVEAMARGALAHSGADISVAISGIAGPGGGSDDKPVGTVWIAWAIRDKPPQSRCFHFGGDRDDVRRQAVLSALSGLIENARD